MYLTVTCTVFGVRLWSTRLRISLGDHFWIYSRIQRYGFQALMLCIMAVYVAVHKTAEIPQLEFITVVDTPFVAHKQILMVQTIQPFLEIAVAVSFLCLSCRFSGAAAEKTFFVQLAEKIVARRKLQLFRSCSSSWSSTSLLRCRA